MSFSLKSTLSAFLIFGLMVCSVECSQRTANVCLISIDTERADHLNAYGYPESVSPCFDRFTKQGVLFTKAVTQAPWTLPSHVSIFTSKYPTTHGVQQLKNRIPDEELMLAEYLKNTGYQTAAFVSATFLGKEFNYQQGFDIYDTEPIDADNAQVTFQRADTWLTDRNSEVPFFLFVHFMDPHLPYTAPAPFNKLFLSPDIVKVKEMEDRFFIPPYQQFSSNDLRYLKSQYNSEIRYADYWLGKLLTRFTELGLFKNTIFVLLSDHGESIGEHGCMGHQHHLYREVTHVPLVWVAPKRIASNLIVDEVVQLIDVAPTIIDLLGLRLPKRMQGKSLVPFFRGEMPAQKSNFALSETSLPKVTRRSYETKSEKYIFHQYNMNWNIDLEEASYFDLADDPAETQNVIGLDYNYVVEYQQQIAGILNLKTIHNTGGWHIRCSSWGEQHEFCVKAQTTGWFVSSQAFHPEKEISIDTTIFTKAVNKNQVNQLVKEKSQNQKLHIADATLRRQKEIRFRVQLMNQERVYFFATEPPDAQVSISLLVDGKPATEMMFIGRNLTHPENAEFELKGCDKAVTIKDGRQPAFQNPGISLWYSYPQRSATQRNEKALLNQELLDKLKALGYVE